MLWNNLIWHDHEQIFPNILELTVTNKITLNILIPLLALPQIMHYFIDGFIWKLKKDEFGWFEKFFKKQ